MTAERLVLFTDAVAAIALTLLILPLMESVSESSGDDRLGTFIHEHIGQFGAFALSFAVIFRFWWAHHKLFRHIVLLRLWILRWSVVWTFAIVLLPIPTALIATYPPSATSVALYGGTLCLASGSLTMLAVYAHRHPEIGGDREPLTRENLLSFVIAFFAELVATVVGSVWADTINFWAFFLMFLAGPVQGVVKARWRREG